MNRKSTIGVLLIYTTIVISISLLIEEFIMFNVAFICGVMGLYYITIGKFPIGKFNKNLKEVLK